MGVSALLKFRKNTIKASSLVTDDFLLCPHPSDDHIFLAQVYTTAAPGDHSKSDPLLLVEILCVALNLAPASVSNRSGPMRVK